MKQIIINADDFGLNRDVNEGIIRAFRAGAIADATLMVKREGSEEAASFALKNPELHVGLHLDLDDLLCKGVEGEERFSIARLSKLLKDDTLISRVEMETEEQMKLFRRMGLPLTHLDGHHHLHALPEVFTIVVGKMVEYGMKSIRVARSYDLVKYPPIEWDDLTANKMGALLKRCGIKGADHFMNICLPDDLKDIKNGVTEVMAHPGLGEKWRENELEILTSSEWRDQLLENGIEKVSFRELTTDNIIGGV